jgi:hypothetical protein
VENEGQGCKNANCLRPAGQGKFNGHGEQRRCVVCWDYSKRNNGKERIPRSKRHV